MRQSSLKFTPPEPEPPTMTARQRRALIRKMYKAGEDGNVAAAEWIAEVEAGNGPEDEAAEVAAARAILDSL